MRKGRLSQIFIHLKEFSNQYFFDYLILDFMPLSKVWNFLIIFYSFPIQKFEILNQIIFEQPNILAQNETTLSVSTLISRKIIFGHLKMFDRA